MADGSELLVEREGELQATTAAIDLISDGGGRTVLVEGPAGIGKTSILRRAWEHAEQSRVRCLSARGSELEIDFPYGVVRQLFEAALSDPAERERAFADAASGAASVFAPDVGGEEGGDQVSFSALHGLYWMTLNLAGDEPLLLFVDDIHWCDRPSLRFLSYLSHRLEGVPVGLVAGLRSTDPGSDPALIADIVGGPDVIAIRPGPLSAEAIGEVVASRLGGSPDRTFNGAVGTATGGNPLLLRQLLSALELEGAEPTARDAGLIADVGPKAVNRTVLRRLGRLEPEAAEVARGLAILGDGAELEAIAEYCGYQNQTVAAAIGALAQAEIVGTGERIGFVHPLVRDALYSDRVPGERQRDHARAARLLLDRGASDEKVAAQLINADVIGEEWAAEVLERAAAEASSKGAMESAAAYLERVLEEPLDDDRRSRLEFGLGLAQVGFDGPSAASHLERAREGLTDPMTSAVATYALTRILLFTGLEERAAEVARETVAELPPELADVGRMIESTELMTAYFGARISDAGERLTELRAAPKPTEPGAAMLAAMTAYDWMMRDGNVADCLPMAEAALDVPELMEYDNGLFWAAGTIVLVCADSPRAMEVWDAALEASHRRGSMFGALTVHLWRGYTQMRHGELTEAGTSLALAVEQCELWGLDAITYAHGCLARNLIHVGRLDEAAATIATEGAADGHGEGAQMFREAEVELLLAQGRPEEALVIADRYLELADWRRSPAFSVRHATRGRALLMLDRREEAIAELGTEVKLAERWGANGSVGRALRVLGEARGDEGAEDLERAIELLRDSPMKLDLAHALAAHGALLRRRRMPTEAREPLREAFELAEACGAEPLAQTVRTELRASGLRPRSAALSGPASLTASERRVADLAAAGQTNKQIAQELFVTPKTVEVHLSNAYRKLDISGRRELAGALGETG
ncbi:MAG: AAA family ATPase [Solirubrobacterales bacterium]